MASSSLSRTDIFDRAHICLSLLSAREKSQEDQLGTTRALFVTWAHSSGALQRSTMSLDYRLRHHERIKMIVLEVLDLIGISATLGPFLPSQKDESISSVSPSWMLPGSKLPNSSRSNTQVPTVKHPIANRDWIREAIDELNSLNNLIKRASSPNAKCYLPSDRPWLDHTIDIGFEDSARSFLISFFGAAIKSSLVNHLAGSLARRRKRLFYQWQLRYGSKQREGVRYPMPGSHAGEFVTAKQKQKIPRRFQLPNIHELPISSPNSQSINQGPKADPRHGRGATDFEAIETGVNDLYPSPDPHYLENGESLCPFCCELLQSSELSDDARQIRWRRHVDNHIEPYVCLSEQCIKPPIFFASFESWVEHMERAHGPAWARHVHSTVWLCDQHTSRLDFRDVADFEAHLMGEHTSPLTQAPPSKAQVLALTKQKQRFDLRDPHVCPLCESQLQGHEEKEDKDLSLVEHIARHLKYLALATSFSSSSIEPLGNVKVNSSEPTSKSSDLMQREHTSPPLVEPFDLQDMKEHLGELGTQPDKETLEESSSTIPEAVAGMDDDYHTRKRKGKQPMPSVAEEDESHKGAEPIRSYYANEQYASLTYERLLFQSESWSSLPDLDSFSYTTGSRTGTSAPSISTAQSSAASRLGPNTVNATIAGQIAPRVNHELPCEFRGLTGCVVTFHQGEEREWIEHIEGHLMDKFPARLRCWFCDTFIFDASDYLSGGDTRHNFHKRMEHIRDHIMSEGYQAHHMRPDRNLIRHLKHERIVSGEMYDDILERLNPTTVPPIPGGRSRRWLEQVWEEPASSYRDRRYSEREDKHHESSKKCHS